MSYRRVFNLGAVSAVFIASPAHAALISWSVFDISGNITDVSTTGTTVAARAGSDLGTANTVDGTTFDINGVTFTDDFTVDTPTHFDSIGGRAGSYTAVNSAYFTLLVNADRDSGGSDSVSFSGLTPGSPYQVQVWAADTANDAGDRALVINDGSATAADIDAAGHATLLFEPGAENSYGQFALGTFTADGSGSQSFLVQHYNQLAAGTPTPTGQVFVNAVQLRLIPEPSTLASLFAAVGIITFRRNRRS